jgi:hypothetical protein
VNNTNPHKKMRVDAWVKPFFAITYKANNAQGIIPFGITPKNQTIYKPTRKADPIRVGLFFC